ncbi:MAG: CAP domain-containing protein [Rubellimicrobium sp.]|nr:CAP domain-containing protein [Rubellimicrobium sp.]
MRLTALFAATVILSGCMGGTTVVITDGVPPPPASGPFVPPVPPGDPFLAYSSFEVRVNDVRAENGVAAVQENAVLNAVATAHAQDLVTYNYLSHIGRDGSDPMDRAIAGGYDAVYMSEVLARGLGNEADVIDGWMGSPKHRENLISPLPEDFGLGRVGSTWVMMLGTEAR